MCIYHQFQSRGPGISNNHFPKSVVPRLIMWCIVLFTRNFIVKRFPWDTFLEQKSRWLVHDYKLKMVFPVKVTAVKPMWQLSVVTVHRLSVSWSVWPSASSGKLFNKFKKSFIEQSWNRMLGACLQRFVCWCVAYYKLRSNFLGPKNRHLMKCREYLAQLAEMWMVCT